MTIRDLPFPRYVGIEYVKELILTEFLVLEQWIIPEGIVIKIFQSKDFGYCLLPEDTKDQRGFTIPRRIFRY